MTIQEAMRALRIVCELHDLERTGVRLPYLVDFITRQELAGHTVNLTTGEIMLNGSEWYSPGPTLAALQEVGNGS